MGGPISAMQDALNELHDDETLLEFTITIDQEDQNPILFKYKDLPVRQAISLLLCLQTE